MTPARWSEIERVFHEVVDLAPPARAAVLADATAGDPELRREVEALLASADDAPGRIREAIASGALALTHDARATMIGATLGPYRVREVIGEGGMGIVYRATRDDGAYSREVAIKVLHPSAVASPLLEARLRDERKLLAALDHPNIVRLIDGGATADGRPYLVMDLVTGVPLAAYARALSVRDRVRLIKAVADALQYAHEQLVVHRDVKPSNILVDARGAPRLLDFGIAKLLGAPELREAQTATGVRLYTVEYASPEQARGDEVTVATDVYGLGAVLYELLAGRPPQRRTASPIETLVEICEREPARPSTLVPPALRRAVAGDLDNIVMRALQKDPRRRYSSAAKLAEDLACYLDGRPVAAREATRRYRARKFVGRHLGKLALAAAIGGALAAATVISFVEMRRADRHAEQAQRDELALVRERASQELAAGRTAQALPYLATALRAEDTPAIRLLVADALRVRSALSATIAVPDGVGGIGWAPDGARFAVVSRTGDLELCRADGTLERTIHVADDLSNPRFDPTGGRVLAVGQATVYVWDAATGARRFATPIPGNGSHPAWFVGARIVVAKMTGEAYVLDGETGAVVATKPRSSFTPVATLAPGGPLVLGHPDGTLEVWDLAGPPRSISAHAGDVSTLAAAPDGRRVYSGGIDHVVRAWNVADWTVAATLVGHGDTVAALAVDADGKRLASTSLDDTAAIWDAATGRMTLGLAGVPYRGFRQVRFAPDGRIATAGDDGVFRLWSRTGTLEASLEADRATSRTHRGYAAAAQNLEFSPDGSRLLAMSTSSVGVWRVDRGASVETRSFPLGSPYVAMWDPAGTRMLVAGDRFAGVWSPDGRTRRASLDRGDRRGWAPAWRADGAAVAIGADDLLVIADRDGNEQRRIPAHRGPVVGVAWSPDGTRLATVGDRELRLWDPATGALVRETPLGARAMALAWSPDGRTLAIGAWDGTLAIARAADGGRERAIDTHLTLVGVAFSPDGRDVIGDSHGGEVAVWDARTGERRFDLPGHTDSVPGAAWSPDGALIATAGFDGWVRLWDAATGELLTTRRTGHVMNMQWSAASDRLLLACQDMMVQIVDVRRATGTRDELLRLLR